MIVKEQKSIEFINDCECIVDLKELERAIVWYQEKPTSRLKHIYINSKYPTVSIHNKKIHVHRLLMLYWNNLRHLDRNIYVHHKDGNKLNASKENLTLIDASQHQSKHNKGKEIGGFQKKKIIESNKKRKGVKMGIKKKGISYTNIWDLHKKGYSINRISKELNYDWSQVKLRIKEIYQNPELLSN